MHAVTGGQMRLFDQEAMERRGIAGAVLMERAGAGVADVVRRLAGTCSPLPQVLFVAGKGNNGGDAFVAARLLHQSGWPVSVWLAAQASALQGDAGYHIRRLAQAGIRVQEKPQASDWVAVGECFPPGGLVVDGLLGTGLTGPARGVAAAAIGAVNRLGREARVVAIDLPSGLQADCGSAAGDVVRADCTVTMEWPKLGMLRGAGPCCTGAVYVVKLGIGGTPEPASPPEPELMTRQDVSRWIPRRECGAHKGDCGHVLVMGGAPGYIGAVAMAARAALLSGAGRVSTLVPSALAHIPVLLNPEVMSHAGAQNAQGGLHVDAWDRLANAADRFSAMVIGPGLTTSDAARDLVRRVLAQFRGVLVLDADALNVLVDRLEWIREAAGKVVLTPHPGEAGRLLGCSAGDVQADRHAALLELVHRSNATVVLKGAATRLARPGGDHRMNLTGNPGMASAGAGDVLAGMIAAMAGQGVNEFDAASAAVYVHGHAGDLAAWHEGALSLTATGLLHRLPAAWHDVCGR